MSDAESSSSSASSERDWAAMMDELKKTRAQVKNLKGKLSKQHEAEAKAAAAPRPSPRRSPRRSARRSPLPTPETVTPVQNTHKNARKSSQTAEKKRKSSSSEESPIVKRRLSYTPKTRTPKEHNMKRIRKVLGLAIKMNLDKKILAKAYRCCVWLLGRSFHVFCVSSFGF